MARLPRRALASAWRHGALSRGVALASALHCFGARATNGDGLRGFTLVEAADGDRLYLSGSYGLLTSSDAGQSWDFVCERGFTGRPPQHTDPKLLRFSDGTLLAGVRSGGVGVSTNDACSFEPLFAEDEDSTLRTVDLAMVDAVEGRALALVEEPTGSATTGSNVRLAAVENSGRGFRYGDVLDSLWGGLSIAVSPSESSRVYLTALSRDLEVVFMRSDDGGDSFTMTPLPDTSATMTPRVLAVDPNDPDIAYVLVDRWQPHPDDADFSLAEDTLLRTSDGGDTFEVWLTQNAKLLDLEFSPDGSALLLAFGDPQVNFNQLVETGDVGLYASPSNSNDFMKLMTASLSCASWGARGIYVCPVMWANRMLALYDMPVSLPFAEPLDQNTFLPLLNFGDVGGSRACGSIATVCEEAWSLGTPPLLPACSTIGMCAPPPGEGGSSGAGSEGGSAGEAGSGGTGDARKPPSRQKSSGCNCSATPRKDLGAWCWLGLGALLLVDRRRHQRRRQSRAAPVA